MLRTLLIQAEALNIIINTGGSFKHYLFKPVKKNPTLFYSSVLFCFASWSLGIVACFQWNIHSRTGILLKQNVDR